MSDVSEFSTDKTGRHILDAAAIDVLKAWRFFSQEAGDVPSMVVALLVIAWAIKGGR